MHGLIVKLTCPSGRRAELIEMMGGGDSHTIPGCLSYIVAEDEVDPNVLWVTEVWSSQEAHEASLLSPPIKQTLSRADVLITGFEKIASTRPVRSSSHPLHNDLESAG